MAINDGIRNGPTISDDDYESEEDTDDRHHRRLGHWRVWSQLNHRRFFLCLLSLCLLHLIGKSF